MGIHIVSVLFLQDRSDSIDKAELRSLFRDLFPDFPRCFMKKFGDTIHANTLPFSTMLERYVNDEFRASDTDFSMSECGNA